MSPANPWPSISPDPKPGLLAELRDMGAVELGFATQAHSPIKDTYSRAFRKAIKGQRFDLAIFDHNKAKLQWGTQHFYRILRSRGVCVIGCQEGSVEDSSKGLLPIAEGLGYSYDYCFCLGRYDEPRLLRRSPNLAGRLFRVGMPCNDNLAQYYGQNAPPKRHVMLAPSYTPRPQKTHAFDPMTDELVKSCGAHDLAREFGLPLLIKEKTMPRFAFKHLEGPSVRVTMDEINLDRLVAESACVIAAPSTLLFKSLQLSIPTAVLGKPYMGQLGAFEFFAGLTESTLDEVRATIRQQQSEGRVSDDYLEQCLEGGSDFSSTRAFLSAFRAVAENPASYKGPPPPAISKLRRIQSRFPGPYKALQGLYHWLKGESN